MADNRVLDILNQSIARELQAIVQYMWQHIMVIGFDSPQLADVFRDLAIEEMKHAEQFAERLDYLGGVPTTKPTPMAVGGAPEEMVRDHIRAEEEAIELYRRAIELSFELKDHATRSLYENILKEEEGHHYELTTIVEKIAPAHKVQRLEEV